MTRGEDERGTINLSLILRIMHTVRFCVKVLPLKLTAKLPRRFEDK